jgi:hypothetical protein
MLKTAHLKAFGIVAVMLLAAVLISSGITNEKGKDWGSPINTIDLRDNMSIEAANNILVDYNITYDDAGNIIKAIRMMSLSLQDIYDEETLTHEIYNEKNIDVEICIELIDGIVRLSVSSFAFGILAESKSFETTPFYDENGRMDAFFDLGGELISYKDIIVDNRVEDCFFKAISNAVSSAVNTVVQVVVAPVVMVAVVVVETVVSTVIAVGATAAEVVATIATATAENIGAITDALGYTLVAYGAVAVGAIVVTSTVVIGVGAGGLVSYTLILSPLFPPLAIAAVALLAVYTACLVLNYYVETKNNNSSSNQSQEEVLIIVGQGSVFTVIGATIYEFEKNNRNKKVEGQYYFAILFDGDVFSTLEPIGREFALKVMRGEVSVNILEGDMLKGIFYGVYTATDNSARKLAHDATGVVPGPAENHSKPNGIPGGIYYDHYHTHDRRSAHAWFGTPTTVPVS